MLRRRTFPVAVTLLAATLAGGGGALTAAPDGLLPTDIDDAIRLGQSGDPQPYVLYHKQRPIGVSRHVIVGTVYTPFIRVALFAKAAQARGHLATREEVDPRLLEPDVVIALRWYVKNEVCNPPTPPQVGLSDGETIVRPWQGAAPKRIAVGAAAGALLRNFGASTPFDDVVTIAVYPRTELVAGRILTVYKRCPRADVSDRAASVSAEVAEILREDIQRWR
jgi:hypothetical protein